MNSFYGFLCAYVRLAGVYGLAHTLPHALFPRHSNNSEFLVDRAMLGLSGAVIGLVYWPSMLHDDGIALECALVRGAPPPEDAWHLPWWLRALPSTVKPKQQ